jgi:hypothetical protein
MTAQPADDFPMMQEVDGDVTSLVMDSNLFAENLSRSLFATAQDEIRPVMGGVYFDLNADNLAVVATDGHKLVRNRILTIKSDVPASFILPHHWEIVGWLCGQLERTIEIVNFYSEVVLVDVEAKRLLRQFLYGVEYSAIRQCKLAIARALSKLYRRLHHVFRIAGSYSQNVVCYFKKETIKNAQSVLAVNYSCERLETGVKCAT